MKDETGLSELFKRCEKGWISDPSKHRNRLVVIDIVILIFIEFLRKSLEIWIATILAMGMSRVIRSSDGESLSCENTATMKIVKVGNEMDKFGIVFFLI